MPRRAENPARIVVTVGGVGTIVLFACYLLLSAVGARVDALGSSPAMESPRQPVLSARRTPGTLSFVTRTARVTNGLAGINGSLPAGSCLTVDWLGARLADTRSGDSFVPGSAVKLVTAAVALEVLGADTTFTTSIRAVKNADGSVADLFFVGGGDPLIVRNEYVASEKYPTFNQTSLESIADGIVAAGVRSITGRIIGVDTYLDAERYVAGWPLEFHGTESGPLGALVVDDGVVIGQPVKPDDPALAAAGELSVLLQARGVTVSGGVAHDVLPSGTETILDVPSASVSSVVGEMLVNSDNNTAETLLKHIGLKGKGLGSTANGLAVVAETLAKWGVPDGWSMLDGSGLSSGNKFSCALFDALLVRFESTFPGLMAVAGKSGTLREMFRDTPLEGLLVGKTGTLNGVKALAGYVPIDGDEPVRFVLLLNKPGVDNKSAYRPIWSLLGDGLRRASAGPRASDLAP